MLLPYFGAFVFLNAIHLFFCLIFDKLGRLLFSFSSLCDFLVVSFVLNMVFERYSRSFNISLARVVEILFAFEDMGKEESPQVTRRTTRFSSSAADLNNGVERTKAKDPPPPTLNDLLFGEDKPISLDDLLSSFPGRRFQILELVRILGPLNCPMPPLFIYGGTSTGKTSTILQIFRHLHRPFVYSSCLTCYSPRILFESVLDQLLLHRKNAANGYSSGKRCERPSDFVNFLREALTSILSNLQGNSGNLRSKKLEGQAKGHMIYLIFDNLELVREWDKSSTMLPFLFNLYDILKMPEVGMIFISNTSPDTYYSCMGYVEPTPVYFPDYTEENLRQIFMRNQSNKKLYSSFLE